MNFQDSLSGSFQIHNIATLTIVLMLYITSLWHIYFIKVCAPDHPYPFCPSPTSCLWKAPICSLYLWISFLLFLKFYMWMRSCGIYLSVWLVAFLINALKVSLCCHKWWDFLLFHDWLIIRCVYVCVCISTSIYILYSLIGHLGFPCLGYCK